MFRDVKHRVVTQGHWHVNYVSTPVRKPGFVKVEIDLHQKYPEVTAAVGDRDILLVIHRRAETEPRNLRVGEDGSVDTVMEFTLPRAFLGYAWNTALDYGRYSVQIVAWTEKQWQPSLRSRLIQFKHKIGV